MIRIHAGFFSVMALLLLTVPLRWILAAVIAGICHEFCHICAVILMHGRIRTITVSGNGCVMETEPLSFGQQMVSILAGPAGGLLLLFFRKEIPEIAVCGFIQSLYNLLPILPLDGGRLLQLLLEHTVPEKTQMLMALTKKTVCFMIAFLFLGLAWISERWFDILFLGSICILRAVPRKFPCKQLRIKVQ